MKWEHRINLKQHLSDNETPTAGEVAVTAANLARSARRWLERPAVTRRVDAFELDVADLEVAVDEWDDLARGAAAGLDAVDAVDDLNRILGDVYDWADGQGVWIAGEKARA